MKLFAMMFNAASMASTEMKHMVAKAADGRGASFGENKMTVATGRALLNAYAMHYRSRQDISRLLRM